MSVTGNSAISRRISSPPLRRLQPYEAKKRWALLPLIAALSMQSQQFPDVTGHLSPPASSDRRKDAACTHLLCHMIHRADKRYRNPRSIKLLGNHSAAATTGPSRGYQQHTAYPFLAQIRRDLLTNPFHHRRRSLISRNHIVCRIKLPLPYLPLGLQRPKGIQRDSVVRILIHIRDIVTPVDRFPTPRLQCP